MLPPVATSDHSLINVKMEAKPKPSSDISFHRIIYWYTKPGWYSFGFVTDLSAFFEYWVSRTTFFNAEWIIYDMRSLSLIKRIDKSRICNLISPLNLLRSELNITTTVISIRGNGVEEMLPYWELPANNVRKSWKMPAASICKCSKLKRSLNGALLHACYRKWCHRKMMLYYRSTEISFSSYKAKLCEVSISTEEFFTRKKPKLDESF